MAIFDKLNPLKKKDDFPEFGEALGARTSSVPGPSFDEGSNLASSPEIPAVSSPAPAGGQQLNSIQSTLNLLVSKVESMKSSLDGLSQRVNSLEQKHSSNASPQPKPQPTTPQPQFNPYQTPQQPQQQTQQATHATTTQSDEDDGWHF